ncbi:MAG: GNAT family protein [Planctomycetota bacterium]
MSLAIPVDDEVSLRLVAPEHAEEITAVARANVEYVGRWLPWCTEKYDVEGCRAWALSSLRGFGERKQLPLSVLEHGRVVGGCGINDWRQQTNADWDHAVAWGEIGYWLAEDATGRGIVTRCVRRLLDYAFDEIGLERMVIRVEPDNARSRAVPERLGFTCEGTSRRVAVWKGRPVDMRVYSMLADEWRAAAGQPAENQLPPGGGGVSNR